jgi:hypothetical protein
VASDGTVGVAESHFEHIVVLTKREVHNVKANNMDQWMKLAGSSFENHIDYLEHLNTSLDMLASIITGRRW